VPQKPSSATTAPSAPRAVTTIVSGHLRSALPRGASPIAAAKAASLAASVSVRLPPGGEPKLVRAISREVAAARALPTPGPALALTGSAADGADGGEGGAEEEGAGDDLSQPSIATRANSPNAERMCGTDAGERSGMQPRREGIVARGAGRPIAGRAAYRWSA
jgi:hypothetical protein